MQEPTLYRVLPFALRGSGPLSVEFVIVTLATIGNAAVLGVLAFGFTVGVLEAFRVMG
jgi:hypothetical protein